MVFRIYILALLVASSAGVGRAAADALPQGETGAAYDAHTEVELVSAQASVQPGERFVVGLRMKPDEGWHTYWKNPGGSGEGPRLRWHLPEGFSAGEPRFPTPEVHAYEVIRTNNYGYSRQFVLPVEIEAPAVIEGDTVRLVLEARWLTCDPRECIPGEATLALEMPVLELHAPERHAIDAAPAKSAWHDLFEKSARDLPEEPAEGSVVFSLEGGVPFLHFEAPGEGAVTRAYFFPEPRNLFDYGAAQPLSATEFGQALELVLVSSADLRELEDGLRGVLTFEQGGSRHAWQIDHRPQAPPASVALDASAPVGGGAGGLFWALVFALLGGMLLNLMPCVFPILSLKVLGLIQSQGISRRHTRLHGLAYAAGVLVSFWVLAALLIAIRGAGEQLNWGFHLQAPAFIAVMALLVFAIGLSLAGVFEMGTSLAGLAGRADRRIGAAGDPAAGSLGGSFGTGVLARRR
jgi:DsbC/DsbD-like thiol-disulfide interchange protein